MGKNEETEIVIQGSTSDLLKQMKLNCGAERHHYSTFDVGRSSFKIILCGINVTCECLQNNLALMALCSEPLKISR
jgi:hypothetical protein